MRFVDWRASAGWANSNLARITWLMIALAAPHRASGQTTEDGRWLTPSSGEAIAAEWVATSADWELEFLIDGQFERRPLAAVARWGALAEATSGAQVVLGSGELFVGQLRELLGERLILANTLVGKVEIPLASVAGVILGAKSDRAQRDALFRRVMAPFQPDRSPTGDVVVLENGDEFTGTLLAIGEETVEIESAVGRVPLEIDRVAAVIFNPALVRRGAPTNSRAWIGLKDGSRLLSAKVEGSDGQTTRLWVASLGAATPPWELSQRAMVFIQPISASHAYLSDLTPAGYKHIPYLNIEWPYELDATAGGAPLRAAGQLYLKGIGMHSAARLSFAIPPNFARFESLAAISDAAGAEGSVVFRVFVDSQERFRSPLVRGGDKPVAVAVDLSNGRVLSLIVDYGQWGDVRDDAVSLDARFAPAPPTTKPN